MSNNATNSPCIEFSYDETRTVVSSHANSTSNAARGLLAAIALAHLVGHYWPPKNIRKSLKEIREELAELPALKVKSKSGAHAYVSNGALLAEYWRKHYGSGLVTAEGRNAFWDTMLGNVDGKPVTPMDFTTRAIAWFDQQGMAHASDIAAAVKPDGSAKPKQTLVERLNEAWQKQRKSGKLDQSEVLAVAQLAVTFMTEGLADISEAVEARLAAIEADKLAKEAAKVEAERLERERAAKAKADAMASILDQMVKAGIDPAQIEAFRAAA